MQKFGNAMDKAMTLVDRVQNRYYADDEMQEVITKWANDNCDSFESDMLRDDYEHKLRSVQALLRNLGSNVIAATVIPNFMKTTAQCLKGKTTDCQNIGGKACLTVNIAQVPGGLRQNGGVNGGRILQACPRGNCTLQTPSRFCVKVFVHVKSQEAKDEYSDANTFLQVSSSYVPAPLMKAILLLVRSYLLPQTTACSCK